MNPNNQTSSGMKQKSPLLEGNLVSTVVTIVLLVLVVVPLALISDLHYQRLFLSQKIDPQEALKEFSLKSQNTITPTISTTESGCFVIVAGAIYNMQVRIGKTAIDPNTGKTHVHSIVDYQCGTRFQPTDMTAIYLDKHKPMGCAQRIAPFVLEPPAPNDPTCE